MNEQQKIELVKFVVHDVCGVRFSGSPTDNYYIEHANLILNKIQELTQNTENNEEIRQNTIPDNTQVRRHQTNGELLHTCGICYEAYPVSELEYDFQNCDLCKSTGKERQTRLDKNGKLFTSGGRLKNEDSIQWVQVLQIQPNHIVINPGGCVPTQDFIDAGWIVHEQVTKYKKK